MKHPSKAVKNWLLENAGKIAAYYLPSYSAEWNPDALLNADLKQHVTKNGSAKEQTRTDPHRHLRLAQHPETA